MKIFAWLRIWIWGFCPKCNSDAPELYICEVCNYDRKSPFGFKKRKEYWNKYLKIKK